MFFGETVTKFLRFGPFGFVLAVKFAGLDHRAMVWLLIVLAKSIHFRRMRVKEEFCTFLRTIVQGDTSCLRLYFVGFDLGIPAC